MKLLFIAHRIPYPPNKGDKIRSFNMLRFLAASHEVALACLVDDRNDLAGVDRLASTVETVLFSAFDPAVKKALSLSGLLNGRPLTVPYFYSPRLQRRIDAFLDKKPVDAVVCFSSPTAEYVWKSRHRERLEADAVRIMDLVDVDSEKWRQYAERSRWPLSWLYRREAKLLRRYEERIAKRFDYLVLVSEGEKRLFQRRVGFGDVRSIPNGVDLDFFHPGFSSFLPKDGPALVFTGAMDYFPNSEGALWFAEHVFPRVRERYPDARFYVVGNRPGAGLLALSAADGIRVTGFVPDVREYVALADVCVAPLRIARGIQNKVLEGMAMGKAVVSTEEGFEGIDAAPGRDLAVASDARTFAEAVLALLDDPRKRAEMGKNARTRVENRYSWEKNLSLLNDILW